TGEECRTLHGHRKSVASLVFSPDGRTLYSSGHDGTVRLWDVSATKEIGRFEVPGYALHALALSRDGKTLAAGCENLTKDAAGVIDARKRWGHPIRLWDVEARREIVPPVRGAHGGMYHTGPVRAIAFSPDGKTLASGGMDGALLLWDAGKGTVLREYQVQNCP